MSFLYKLLRTSNDIKAVSKGKIGRRIARRAYGKATGKVARRLFK